MGPVVACGYCHALLAPSTAHPSTRATRPRDVTLLVDRSASMRGSGAQIRAGVRATLEALDAADAVRVTVFDHDRETLGDGWLGLAPEVIDRVDAFLAAHPARGGTELERMIEHAAEGSPREGRTPVVVLVTDGAVGNAGRLIRRAEELLRGRRLFVLGCGPSPDRRLCARLARAGGGAAEVLADREVDGEALARFGRKVREGGPVLTGLSVTFEGIEVEPVGDALPDLHGGEPVQLLARYARPGAGHAVITGITADGAPFRQRIPVVLPVLADAPGLGRLWAKRRIDGLLEAAATEPRRAKAREAEALALALEHALVTPLTSLVAEDEEAVTDAPPRRVEQPAPQAAAAAERAGGFAAGDLAAMDAELAEDRAAPAPCCAAPPPPRCAAPTGAPPPLAGRSRTSGGPAPEARRKASLPGLGLVAKMKKMADSFFEGEAEETPARSIAQPPPRPREGVRCEVRYAEEELAWLRARATGELDLVFLVDETGSMGPYIEEVKTRLLSLIDALRGLPLCSSLRLGLVTYRDHPPQDHSYASKKTELTEDVGAIERAVWAMTASGGGDGPESVTDGLADVVRMDWRPGAARAVVWFGDAPPHGVEPSGDGFPNGCPCGDHWYTQAESLREMGIAVYGVGCLPGLRSYVGAEEVFRTVSDTTRGIYLPLTQSSLLVPLMAAAAATELDRRRVDEHVAAALEVYADLLRDTDDAERVRWLHEVLHGAGVEPRAIRHEEGARKVRAVSARPLTPADVEGALHRLRLAGRAA